MQHKPPTTAASTPFAAVLILLLFAGAVGLAKPVRAQTLLIDDLKEQQQPEAARAFRTHSQRVECNSIQDAIDRCKDARDEQPEKELARKTKTSEEIKKGQRNIADIEKKKEAKQKELKKQTRGALAVLMQDMDEQIVRLRREMADLVTDQEEREKALDIPRRIGNGERCVHYRAGMREHFDDVVKMLKDRKFFSADAKASKEAQKYAQQIVDHIESEARGHKDQEDAWRNRVVAWQEVLDLKLWSER